MISLKKIKKFIKKIIYFLKRNKTDNLLEKLIPEIIVVDIGSSYFIDNKWQFYLNSKKITWISVEPNDNRLDYLKNWQYKSNLVIKNICFSNTKGEKTLYVTQIDSGSSLKKPNIHPAMSKRMGKVKKNYLFPFKEKKIISETLDSLMQTIDQKPCFLKIDTQGSELDILKGATQLLDKKKIIGLETEAPLWAKPNYEDSGKFWQISQFLENYDFEMLKIFPYQTESRIKNKTKSQLINNECDAIFALRPDVLKKLDINKKLSIIPFYYTYFLYEEIINFIEDNDDVYSFIKDDKNLFPFYKNLFKKI